MCCIRVLKKEGPPNTTFRLVALESNAQCLINRHVLEINLDGDCECDSEMIETVIIRSAYSSYWRETVLVLVIVM